MNPLKSVFVLSYAVLLFISCNETKEKINKAGEAVGQAAGEFVSGVTSGVEKAWETKVDLPKNLEAQGIQFGKITVSSDSGATDNLVTVYVIFNNNFSSDLTAKAYDNKGIEMGRSKIKVEGKKDEARYIEFHFDKRTNIDNDSRVTIE